MTEAQKPWTVRRLRSRWKPHKTRLGEQQDHPTVVRFHRACSWLSQAESAGEAGDLDMNVLTRWIAFNALYGQWDDRERSPQPDVKCWKAFLDRMRALDHDGLLADVLEQHRKLVIALLEDEYLATYYWEDPTDQRARKVNQARFTTHSIYYEKKYGLILERVVERIYLLRCQMVHGAATWNSQLNRTSVRRCAIMLDHIMTACMRIWIDFGADEDWGVMCYPPE